MTRDAGPAQLPLESGPARILVADPIAEDGVERLRSAGRVDVHPEREGFHDPAIVACKRRTAVGITPGGKLLLVAVEEPVYLETAACILRHHMLIKPARNRAAAMEMK